MAMIKELERTNHALRRQYAPHHSDEPIIRVNDLSIRYESGFALDHISFELKRSIRLAVLGPNGAGKSTLIKVIAGVLSPTSGSVQVYGEEPGGHICIAYVPQRSQVDWNFPVSVRDVVMMGRIGKMGLFRRPGKTDWEVVERALEEVNLTSLAKRQIGELSGGQQQRMFVARALAQEAELMLMDEPLTGLDAGSQEDLFRILDLLHDRRVTIIVALHDLKMAARRFESVMLLNHRLVGLGTPSEVFSTHNLIEAYGSQRIPEHAPAATAGDQASTVDDWAMLDDTCCVEGEHHHD